MVGSERYGRGVGKYGRKTVRYGWEAEKYSWEAARYGRAGFSSRAGRRLKNRLLRFLSHLLCLVKRRVT